MQIKTDILIIGSGIAGLSLALNIADHHQVTIVTKREASEANTNYAQGGIASVFTSGDTFQSHIEDTIVAGADLCNREVVKKIVGDAPSLINELIERGVRFSKNSDNEYDLGREGGHSERRVLHAGDITGQELERALIEKVRAHSNIKVAEFHTAIDLLMSNKINKSSSEKTCLGAYVLDEKNDQIHTFISKVTILATGGAGKVYLYTSNPDIATGDGMAMAYRAGAIMSNLEFVQFHPTCLYNPGGWALAANKPLLAQKSFLISEAVRGEGAVLLTRDRKPFMEKYHHLKELAPRDIVARAIDYEMKKRGDSFVLLDISHKPAPFILERFPNIYKMCLEFGFDITKGPIPVVPAAHYFCGGVKTELNGQTNIENLFAIGETACTGLHGANRLASNSLLEGAAMARYCSEYLKAQLSKIVYTDLKIRDWDAGLATAADEMVVITQNWEEIRHFMWNYVGIVRSDKRLKRAKKRIQMLKEEIGEYYWNFKINRDLVELRNLADVAELVIDCALQRKESRGLHYNLDYLEMKESEKKDTII